MSKYAYLDKEHKEMVYAYNCNENHRNREYFCFNPACNGKMSLALPTVKKKYFLIKDSKNHKNCNRLYRDYDPTQYCEEKFDLEKAIDNLINATNNVNTAHSKSHNKNSFGNGNILPLSTIPQIYSMCINMNYDDIYNKMEIWKIFVDDSCNHIMTKGIWGKRFILCSFYRYNNNTRSIYFKYPINPALSNQYIIETNFGDNDNLFREIQKDTYNQSHVVIAGNWQDVKNYDKKTSKTIVLSKSQVWVVR